jgi:hypothetical protein
MKQVLVEKHKEDFKSFMANVTLGILPEHPALDDEILINIKQKLKEEDFKKIEEIYAKNPRRSYINAFRTYLEDYHPRLFYRHVLRVIEEAVRPRFEHDYPNYAKAIRSYLRYKPYEPVEAGAEWRAYFESRFYGAIERFFEDALPEHKLTLNLLLWSFLGQEILPIYRQDINYKANNPDDKKLFDRRQEEFVTLSAFREEYSFVWDIVQNNVTTIFYFDKVEGMPQMVVYEIDPYVDSGKGDVYARYASKNIFSIEHRDPERIDIISPENIKEGVKAVINTYSVLRNENNDEKQYQYQAIRFFIRSGIFNPLKAAYYRTGSGPDYMDLLENAPTEIINTLKNQYKTSTGRLPGLKNEHGEEDQALVKKRGKAYKYDEKYSKEENEALDAVIRYMDENDARALSARIAVFEAGFFSLTKDVDWGGPVLPDTLLRVNFVAMRV